MTDWEPTEYDLHAYVDGLLEPEQREKVDVWLAAHPGHEATVRGWQTNARELRASLSACLTADIPARLDPVNIRKAIHARRRSYVSLVASLLLFLGVGGLGGWQARDLLLVQGRLPMQDAVQAYRLFAAVGRDTTFDMKNVSDLQVWLARNMRGAVVPEDLTRLGLNTVGIRLLISEPGAAALIVYEDQVGNRYSLFVRPPDPARDRLQPGLRSDDGVVTQYWSSGQYNYAVVGPEGSVKVQRMAQYLEL